MSCSYVVNCTALRRSTFQYHPDNMERRYSAPIGYYPQTVDTVPPHEPLEALLRPHTDETRPHAAVLLGPASLRLYLSDEG